MVQKKSSYQQNRPRKTPASRSRTPLVVALILLVLLAGAVLLVYRHHQNSTNAARAAAASNSAAKNAAPAADNSSNENRKASSSPSSTLDTGGSSTSSSSPASFSVQIVNANVNNGNLHIGTLVNGITSGTCTLTASQSGQSTLQLGSSSVSQDVNNYDCGVFNIATSTFPTGGNWKIILTVSSNGASNSSNTTVDI